MNKEAFLTTKRAFLRTFVSEDLEAVKVMLMDEDVMKHTGFRKVQSHEQCIDLLEKWTRDEGVWAAIEKDTQKLFGWFMLKKTKSDDPELGFMLSKSFWNKGLTTEIATSLLALAKTIEGNKRVFAVTDECNSASRKVLEKIGMSLCKKQPHSKGTVCYEYYSR